MNSRAARRHVSAGAILALAIWMGGLPAAAADEPVPDTPSAAATAAPIVGGDTAADTTPVPEPSPSVDPTTPAPEPSATTEPEPSPEPTPTETPSDEPGQTEPDGSEPVPTPTDERPAPDVRPTPGTGPVSSEHRRGSDPDATEAASTVSVADFDCAALTTTVTLDNSAIAYATGFTVTTSRFSWAAGFDVLSVQRFSVPAATLQTVSVILPPDAYVRILAESTRGPSMTKDGACGSYVYDPRATVDSMDCSTLDAAVSLDNSRSSDIVQFAVTKTAAGGAYPGSTTDWFTLSAGEVRNLKVVLRAYAVNTVLVSASYPSSTELARGETTCDYVARASIEPFDCESLTTRALLDNRSAPVPTEYRVLSETRDQTLLDQSVEVAAGTSAQVTVPVGNDVESVVWVQGPGGWVLASSQATCGVMVIDPRAALEFDCSSLTATVKLDNTRSTVRVEYWASLNYSNMDFDPDVYFSKVVEPGQAAELKVPIVDSVVTTISVRSEGHLLIRQRGPLCGLVKVSDVNCASRTIELTLHDASGDPRGRGFYVSSTSYPKAPGTFHQHVGVPYGGTTVTVIPVNQLPGGGLRISEYDGGVVFEETLDVSCSPSIGPGSAPGTTTSAAGMLAATGPERLPQLALGGLLLLTLGGVLLRVGREAPA